MCAWHLCADQHTLWCRHSLKWNTSTFKYYVKITQKCDPELIKKMQEFLGIGVVYPSGNYRLRFENQADIQSLYNRLQPFLKIKQIKYELLLLRHILK